MAYFVSEANNGKTYTIAKGDSVTVVLHSTYWTIDGSSNPAVMKAVGQQTASPPANPCHAGQGCGTISQKFVAVGPGTAHLKASRTSCGEALQCSPSPQRWDVSIVVKA